MKPLSFPFSIVCFTLLLMSAVTHAEIASERFSAIVAKNTFRLWPPNPLTIEVPPPPIRPQITLQGITTILGRTQALLTIRSQSKSVELPETSCVLAEGDSRSDIVVLEISAELGTVRISNLGLEQTLVLRH